MNTTWKSKAVFASAITLLFLACYQHFLLGYMGDKISYLAVTTRWLNGEHLYTDIFEVVPPLVVWFYALPVSLSMMLGVEDFKILMLFAFAWVAMSVFLSISMLAQHPQFKNNTHRQITLCIVFAYIFIVFVNPPFFFDRENIFFILVMPYIISLMPSVIRIPRKNFINVLVGLSAGIGICFKPQCSIFFLLLLPAGLFLTRNIRVLFRLENLIVYCIALIYVALIFGYYPTYISTILPMALATYGECNRNLVGFLLYGTSVLFMAGVGFSEFRFRYTSPYRQDIYYLMYVCLLFVVYIAQNNGWPYTYILLMQSLILTICFIVWEFSYLKDIAHAHGLNTRPFIHGLRACYMSLIGAFVVIASQYGSAMIIGNAEYEFGSKNLARTHLIKIKQNPPKTYYSETANYITEHHIKTFGTINLSFGKWSQIEDSTDAHMKTRFSHLWMLPKFLHSDEAFRRQHQWILDFIGNAYAEDLNNKKPEVVFVDIKPKSYTITENDDVDLLKFVSHGNFQEAWSKYRLEKTIDFCQKEDGTLEKFNCRFEIYRRNS